jgi:hypothetical protein
MPIKWLLGMEHVQLYNQWIMRSGSKVTAFFCFFCQYILVFLGGAAVCMLYLDRLIPKYANILTI